MPKHLELSDAASLAPHGIDELEHVFLFSKHCKLPVLESFFVAIARPVSPAQPTYSPVTLNVGGSPSSPIPAALHFDKCSLFAAE